MTDEIAPQAATVPQAQVPDAGPIPGLPIAQPAPVAAQPEPVAAETAPLEEQPLCQTCTRYPDCPKLALVRRVSAADPVVRSCGIYLPITPAVPAQE